MQSFDIAIVGGGMIGLTLAVSLSGHGMSVVVLDNAIPDSKWQTISATEAAALRVSAISLATEQVFKHCKIWDDLAKQRICSYLEMDVKEKDSFAHIHFSHEQVHQPYLGHIIENDRICSALWQQAKNCADITLLAPANIQSMHLDGTTNVIQLENGQLINARLLVGADGGRSKVRQQAGFPITFWDYGQQAIVATVRTEQPHNNVARQVFTKYGPLAFLPLWDRHLCSIVWSQDTEQAAELMMMPEQNFNHAVTAAFDAQLGVCSLQSERKDFPLRMQCAKQWVDEGVVIIGDAAHTIHPLAGQGANLGILDAAALAEVLIQLKLADKDIGSRKNLRAFERWRKTEASEMVATMEGFKQLFSGDNPAKKLLRGAGMSLTHSLPGLKNAIIQKAMGINGELPRMAR